MKTLQQIILMLICIISSGIPALADQKQQAFFVHRNDGDFNVVFFSEVDSMVYSKLDTDSILHDDYITQEIWTPDTVFRIPIAAIDSVTFQTPDNIYTRDAKIMSDRLRDYILSADSLDLYLSPSTPADLLPAVGDKMVTTERSEKLPGGFIGKVEKIEDIGTFIKIECSELKIEDVFTRYYGFFHITGKTTDQNDKNRNLQKIIPEWPIDWTFDLGTIKINKSEGITLDNFWDYFDGGSGWNTSGSLELPDMRITGCLIFEKEIGTYLSLSLGGTYKVALDWSIYGSISKGGDIVQIPLSVLPLAPLTYLYGKCGLTMGIGGTVSFGSKLDVTGGYALSFTYSDRSPANLPPKATINVKNTNFDPVVVSGDITANIGIFLDLSVYYTALKMGTVLEKGWQSSLGGSLGLSDFENMKKDYEVYESARNITWSLTPYIQKKIVAECPGLSYDKVFGFQYENPLLTAKIVPDFSNLDFTSNNALSYTFKADVAENVFPETPVGFRLIDENGNILFNDYFQESYSNIPLWIESFPHYELTMNRPLEVNKKYKLYPILKLFSNAEMLCSPMKEILLKVEAYTDGADIISYDKAVCYGHVLDNFNVADACIVGILYSEEPENIHYSKQIPATLSEDKTFKVELSGLEESQKYYYCAYLKSGNNYYYGEIKSFKTPKIPDDAVDLGLSMLWAKHNVGANAEGEAGGLYGWADATGSNTTFDVFSKDGSAWISPLYGGANPPASISGNAAYDIATKQWGGAWRMPTEAEMAELIDNCTAEPEVLNGISGVRLTSKINGKSIFLPLAGDRFGSEYRETEYLGYYWTGTLNTDNRFNAYRMSLTGSDATIDNYPRYIGHSVRPVRNRD